MSHLLEDHPDWPKNAMTTPTPRVERVKNETDGTPCLVRYMIELPKRIAKLEAERDSLKRHAEAMAEDLMLALPVGCRSSAIDAYRRDFPKEEA